MGFNDGFPDGQSQSASAFRAGARLVNSIKALEDFFQFLRRHSYAGIRDDQHDISVR
jgi:hypothetical protein